MVERRTRARRRAGYTLLELLIVGVLAASLGSVILLSARSLSGAFRTSSSLVEVESKARQAVERVSELLETAGADLFAPPSVVPPFSTSTVDFQRPTSYVGGAVTWGDTERLALENSPEDPPDGLDNDGDGLVDEGRIVWTEAVGLPGQRRHVLAGGVLPTIEGETLGNGLDDNGNGLVDEQGLAITYAGSTLEVQITVAREVAPGVTLERTVRRTVVLSN